MAVALVALAALQPQGRAYTYLGCRWPDAPVGATTIRYVGGNDAATWGTAAQRWNESDGNVAFEENPVAGLFIASSADYGNVGFDGFIQYACVGGVFVPRYVQVGLNTFYTHGYPPGMKAAVAGHELGHAAGLGHHDTGDCGSRPLMHSSSARWVQCGIEHPRPDDTAGTRGLYP
ncbi:MAG TPA: hypothetical protein VHF47_06695 [Acidimicrobiales bacterium]|nr:hypothetical protein [Acidimicrobiales bacterium]